MFKMGEIRGGLHQTSQVLGNPVLTEFICLNK